MLNGSPKTIGWQIYEDDGLAAFLYGDKELFTCTIGELKELVSITLETYGALRSIVERQGALGELPVIKAAEEVLKNINA